MQRGLDGNLEHFFTQYRVYLVVFLFFQWSMGRLGLDPRRRPLKLLNGMLRRPRSFGDSGRSLAPYLELRWLGLVVPEGSL